MKACFFLLRRYLLPRGGNLLSFALWVSVVSVALGIAQLILVLSVMTGFLNLLEEKYSAITSQVVVLPRQGTPMDPEFRKKLEAISGVEAVTPFGLGQGMAIKNGVAGINLEGIEWESSSKVTPWDQVWVEKPDFEAQAKEVHWIWLGKQLAEKLQAKVGDDIQVLLPDENKNRYIPFKVTGVIKFGIYDHDLHHTVVSLNSFNEWFNRFSSEPMYKTRLRPGADLNLVSAEMKEVVGDKAAVRRWNEVNKNIFLAVQHQKKLLFLVLEIVVALAALNVINLLMMSAHQRKRDVAILRAMGFRFRSVVFFFVAQGAAVGAAGIIGGIVLGRVVAAVVERFQPAILSEAIYNVSRLPLKTEIADVVAVSAVAFLLCVVFSVLPALKAAAARPVEALRNE